MRGYTAAAQSTCRIRCGTPSRSGGTRGAASKAVPGANRTDGSVAPLFRREPDS